MKNQHFILLGIIIVIAAAAGIAGWIEIYETVMAVRAGCRPH